MFPLPSSAQKATGFHCHPSHYTLYQGQISVLNKGFRCRLFLSEYEYWVFSEVALWNCCDPVCPTTSFTSWKEVLWTLTRRCSLAAALSQCGLGKNHCMSWNCTRPRMVQHELVFCLFMPACFLQFKRKMFQDVGLSIFYQDFLSMSMFTKEVFLIKAKWMS